MNIRNINNMAVISNLIIYIYIYLDINIYKYIYIYVLKLKKLIKILTHHNLFYHFYFL